MQKGAILLIVYLIMNDKCQVQTFKGNLEIPNFQTLRNLEEHKIHSIKMQHLIQEV